MSNHLTNYNPNQSIQSATLTPEQQKQINKLLEQSKSTNTIHAYQTDWKLFLDFCSIHNQIPLPAQTETILLYISELSKTQKYATIKRKLSSINKAHKTAGHMSPTYNPLVKDMMDGVARTIGNKQTPKKAITLNDLKLIIDVIDVSILQGIRDKAIILTGFSTASRRSELVSINVQDITFTNEGMDILIHEEKTQEYKMKSVIYSNNDYCPVTSLKQWLEASQIKQNALFRQINKAGKIGERLTDQSVKDIVKKYAKQAGLDPNQYAGHSLRSGFATSAAEEGFNDVAIMKTTGHNTREMVDRYTQTGNRYKNNATSILRNIEE